MRHDVIGILQHAVGTGIGDHDAGEPADRKHEDEADRPQHRRTELGNARSACERACALCLNLAHPGGNLTGFTSFEFSIGTKWLEALKQTAPHVTRLALVFNPQSAPFAELFMRPIKAAALSLSVEPIGAAVRDPADVDRVFDTLAREPNGGLMVLPDISMINYREPIIALAARHSVPAVYPFRFFAASGGLMSYGTDVAEVFRRAAAYVDRILKGTSPGELPIQAPTKYELVINI